MPGEDTAAAIGGFAGGVLAGGVAGVACGAAGGAFAAGACGGALRAGGTYVGAQVGQYAYNNPQIMPQNSPNGMWGLPYGRHMLDQDDIDLSRIIRDPSDHSWDAKDATIEELSCLLVGFRADSDVAQVTHTMQHVSIDYVHIDIWQETSCIIGC